MAWDPTSDELFNLLPEKRQEAFKYLMNTQGKGLRSDLVRCVAHAYTNNSTDSLIVGQCIEMIHTASLAIDDLPNYDNATIRRGKPCVHLVCGVDIARFTAIDMVYLAMNKISSLVTNCTFDDFSICLWNVLQGQKDDLMFKYKEKSVSSVLDIHLNKTGRLFELCMACGYKVATNPYSYKDVVIQKLKEYGRCIGIMFQLMDDIIDHNSTASEAHKDVHIDYHLGRPSCVLTVGYAETINLMKALNQSCIDILSSPDTQLSEGGAMNIYDAVQGRILEKLEQLI